MTHDNPYDQREQDARDEDRRQSLQDGAEEAENERRQMARFASPDMQAPSIIGETE